jgi:hypothetical protein
MRDGGPVVVEVEIAEAAALCHVRDGLRDRLLAHLGADVEHAEDGAVLEQRAARVKRQRRPTEGPTTARRARTDMANTGSCHVTGLQGC